MTFNLTPEELVSLIYHIISDSELPPENIRGNLRDIARWRLAKAMQYRLLKP